MFREIFLCKNYIYTKKLQDLSFKYNQIQKAYEINLSLIQLSHVLYSTLLIKQNIKLLIQTHTQIKSFSSSQGIHCQQKIPKESLFNFQLLWYSPPQVTQAALPSELLQSQFLEIELLLHLLRHPEAAMHFDVTVHNN